MNESILIDDDAAFEAPVRAARFEPSEYQAAIFEWIQCGTGDAIVNAVAGSGKTTTLAEASKLLPGVIPSRVLEQRGNTTRATNPHACSAIFCAFNSHIVKELVKRFGIDDVKIECKTIHSIGLATLARHFDKQPTVDGNKYHNLVRKESWRLAEEMPAVNRTDLVSALGDLVELCMATLTTPGSLPLDRENEHIALGRSGGNAITALSSLVSHFGLTLPCPVEKIAPAVNAVLSAGILQAQEDHVISFSDMLWLPWVWGLQPRTYDWVFVDECQDLNRAQLEMVLKLRAIGKKVAEPDFYHLTGRMIFVGDPRQAIYGFSGADAASYANIKERTGASEFPLSVSYRCPVLVVREAQVIVPGIQPRPNAPLGTVRYISETDLYANVKEGDLLLCRMTAPLIATCLDLIRQKVPARVRGKDIGKMLVKTVQIVSERRDFEFITFPKHLHKYTQEQIAKLKGRDDVESQVERLWDISQALTACFDGDYKAFEDNIKFDSREEVEQFKESIQRLFSDDRPGVWLSTVHKAKGLEAPRVFILRPDKLPLVWRGQQAWEMEQEMNLKYVAITRALEELVYVRQAGEPL